MKNPKEQNLDIQQRSSSIKAHIILIRGHRVIIDADLAALYGVKTKRLKEQVKRNSERFPAGFVLQLTETEMKEVVAKCDHLKKLKFSSTLPLVFTEHGAIMAATVLNSRVAIETSILVVRAFIHAREIISEHRELKQRLERLEERVARGFQENEDELQAVRFAIQQLTNLPPPSSKKTDRVWEKGMMYRIKPLNVFRRTS
jgi:ORF6N domain